MFWTRWRLNEWGKWARGGMPGISTCSPMAFSSRGSHHSNEMPEHIAQVDRVILSAPQPERSVLICFYSKSGPMHEKARQLGLDRWKFKRVLVRGESYVENNL